MMRILPDGMEYMFAYVYHYLVPRKHRDSKWVNALLVEILQTSSQ